MLFSFSACLQTATFLSLNVSDITNAISLFIFLVVNITSQKSDVFIFGVLVLQESN